MEPSLWDAFIRIAVSLPIVALLTYLFIKYGFTRTYTRRQGNLEILEQISLGPRATLNIIKVGSEYLLFSATEKEITLIKQLDDYQKIETADFRNHLRDAVKSLGRGRGLNG